MRASLLGFFFVFCPATLFSQKESEADTISNSSVLRTVKTCVVNDTTAPKRLSGIGSVLPNFKRESYIRSLMSAVDSVWRQEIGISFSYSEISYHDSKLNREPFEEMLYLIRICPPEFEMAVIFTDQDVQTEIFKNWADTTIMGENRRDFGYLLLYYFDMRISLKDKGGNPVLFTVLNHEIGHMFGIKRHADDWHSFMFFSPYDSCGEWTEEAIGIISKNRYIYWTPLQRKHGHSYRNNYSPKP